MKFLNSGTGVSDDEQNKEADEQKSPEVETDKAPKVGPGKIVWIPEGASVGYGAITLAKVSGNV